MIWYRVGARDEEPGQTGKSHFLEHMLFKGTDRYAKGEIDRITAVGGGRNNAFTSHDFTAYYFSFASDRWEVSLDIEANRMTRTLFDPQEYASERAVVIEELRMMKDHPWSALLEEVEATLFRLHPYGTPVVGRIADLESASAADMKRYYETFYRPDAAALVIVGDLNPEATLRAVRRTFGRIPVPSCAIPRRPMIPEPAASGERRVVLERETNASRLVVASVAPRFGDSDEPAVRVAAAILGDGKSSRLYRSLVDRKRLASEVGEDYSPRLDPGPVFLFAEASGQRDRAAVEAALLEEIDRLTQSRPRSSELERAKLRVAARHLFSRETMQGEAEAIGEQFVLSIDREVPDLVDRIRAVTSEDVRRVTGNCFQPARRTIGWMVPPSTAARGRRRENPRASQTPPSAPLAVPDPSPRLKASPGRTRIDLPVEPVRVELPAIDHRFPNGLRILAHQSGGSATASVEIEIAAGSRDEVEPLAGLARLTAMMLTQGTRNRSAEEIAESVESRGGQLEVEGLFDRTRIRLEGLTADLGLSLSLLAEIVIRSSFPAARVRFQKDLLVDEIQSEKDNPAVVASRALSELLYRGHPLHRPASGYQRTVRQLDRSRVVQFARAFYLPGNVRIAVSSGAPPGDVLRMVRRFWGAWRGSEPHHSAPRPIPAHPPSVKRIVVSKEQTHVLLGHLGIRRSDPDFVTGQVLDMILGAGPGFVSRIPRVLRDSMGLAYTTWSDLTQSAGIEPGRFAAYIATAPENEKRAIAALRGEIERFRAEGPTEREVAEARAHLTGRHVFEVETNSSRCEMLHYLARHDLGLDYLSRYPGEVAAVTRAAVRDAAKRLLRPDQLSTVIVGPATS